MHELAEVLWPFPRSLTGNGVRQTLSVLADLLPGLVIHEAQMIPVVGQEFSFHGFRFEVLEKDENRIARLRIKPL